MINIKKIKKAAKTRFFLFVICTLFSSITTSNAQNTNSITLKKNNFKIVFSNEEAGPIKIAFEAFKKDFKNVMGFEPIITDKLSKDLAITEIVIVNRNNNYLKAPAKKPLDNFESHRVYADAKNNKIYIEGYDLRGTIFAMYTFSEKILGIPPLHYWSSWVPEPKTEIKIANNYDVFFKSPQVRYRTILPGDQDFFKPWRRRSDFNNQVWLETTLRLKMNTVECYSTVRPKGKLNDYAYLIDSYGLAITSHHISALNSSFATWEKYWEKEREKTPPKFLLSNKKEILEFFEYNAKTVVNSGIENLWTIAFRGKDDEPFWNIFEDAPKDDKGRAEVINEMLKIQLDVIKKATKNPNPYVRITFYDEIASLMAKGYLKPPVSKNMIWTYVAARRDPYPFDDLVNFNSEKPVKLGYYMNFGFASTGAHVAPAESPWKMEFNYRYINDKSPLYFSVVNIGNYREFVLELSAHANMLWDYDAYNSDAFVLEYSKQYFGENHAKEIAALYRDFYDAYWLPKASEFKGMERQFVFQDLRYARAFDHLFKRAYKKSGKIDMNPLRDIGFESIPGRSFRIDLEDNNSENQVEALLRGMRQCIPKFDAVAKRSDEIIAKLENNKKVFFNDNLRVFSHYMAHLSKSLYHFTLAYKDQNNTAIATSNLNLADKQIQVAEKYLEQWDHGIFSTWYSGADDMKRTFQPSKLRDMIKTLKKKAEKASE